MATFPYANIFVTGASRGIGLEFVKQLVKVGGVKNLFATYRSSSQADELKKIAADNSSLVKLFELDVRGYDQFQNVADQISQQVGNDGLNLLVLNAGIYIKNDFDEITREEMLDTYEVNVVAPLLMTRTFLPLLKKSVSAGHKTHVALISSQYGSIAQNDTGHALSYRASKAALNQISKGLSNNFSKDNIIIIPYHPGWVQTDMGGKEALVKTVDSVSGLLDQFKVAEIAKAGLLIRYDGVVIPY